MQILRLLAARRFRRRRRRAVSTITTTATAPVTPRGCGGVYVCAYGEEEDEGPFFDLDLSCCSAPASSAGSQAAESSSGSESEDTSSFAAAADARGDLDFVISLQRSRSGSPCYEERLFFRGAVAQPRRPTPPPLMFCASEPSDAASRARHSSASASRRGGGGRLQLRTLSFGSAKAAFYGGRPSLSQSTSSARSARLFAACGSPDQDLLRDEGKISRPSPSGDVIRRYLSKISSRLRRVGVAVAPAAAELRLRKSRSASATTQVSTAAAAAQSSPPARRDDSLVEKQDGIASAIAHCKESLHRASVSEVDTSLVRSRSDPGP